jgi:hypothetical protein
MWRADGAAAPASQADSPARTARPSPRYRCGLYVWRDGVLRGFAVDLDAPERVLRVAVEAQGRTVAEFSTGEPRPDLAEAAPGNVAGFACDFADLAEADRAALEAALAAAAPETPLGVETLALRVGADGPRIHLGGGGVSFGDALAQCRAARRRAAPPPLKRADALRGPRFIAGVDGLWGTVLRGWAVDLADARAPVRLSLQAKGRTLTEFDTGDHRADIGAVLVGNVAGFAIDLAALPDAEREALAAALAEADPAAPTPPGLLALRVLADDSLIDLGGFGVKAGALRAAVGGAPAAEPADKAPPPEATDRAPSPEATDKAPARVRAAPRDPGASALHWLLAHFGVDEPADARPPRRFAVKLLTDIERNPAVSDAVRRHAREIVDLFDPFYYLDRLDRPEEAAANPLLHYTLAGWRDGASPHPLFSPAHYKSRRGERAGDPLLDFVREGARLDLDPHPLFDMAFYRARWLEGDKQVNPLLHYLETGGALRLDPSPRFDTSGFLESFGLGAATEVPLEAYLVTPQYWGFALFAGFDAGLYRHQIAVERGERLAEPPHVHYLSRGFRDSTLRPNLLFDPAFYLERNKLTLDEPALAHYLREGEAAGFSCHAHFSPVFYNAERGVEGGAGALEHALAHPGQHRSDPRMAAPIDPRLLDFVRGLVAENGSEEFNIAIYREANPDLNWMDDAAVAAHYRLNGDQEGRVASRSRFMRMSDMRVRDLPLGFVFEDYLSIYADLKHLEGRYLNGLFHWLRHGRDENRLIGKWQFHIDGLTLDLASAAAPLKVVRQSERVDLCILIHAFYPDLLPELVGFAQNFRDVSFDIFINVVDLAWTPELQEELRAICPGAFVMLSNDNGRDIGGFTRLLGHIDIGRYDAFAFLHSKKSPHIAAEKGEHWRRQLLHAIAGSPETARECVSLLKQDPGIGMIGAKEWRSKEMGKNVEQYERLLDVLGVRGRNRDLDYLSGFMFLIRSDVVARLYETLHTLDFEYGGDKDVEYHRDGQIAHGVERAVPALVREMGYKVHYR